MKGMNSPHITVGLVDDQQLVRAGFSLVLDSQDDIEVLWQAEQGQQACELATQQPVDIMLMDVQMPEMDGLQATRDDVRERFLATLPRLQRLQKIPFQRFGSDGKKIAHTLHALALLNQHLRSK